MLPVVRRPSAAFGRRSGGQEDQKDKPYQNARRFVFLILLPTTPRVARHDRSCRSNAQLSSPFAFVCFVPSL